MIYESAIFAEDAKLNWTFPLHNPTDLLQLFQARLDNSENNS
jgi:hypothetical protein